jgi:flagellin-like protein
MNNKGVSPVVAIILMMTITFVLAGVLYVWVTGLQEEEYDPEKDHDISDGTGVGHVAQKNQYARTLTIVDKQGNEHEIDVSLSIFDVAKIGDEICIVDGEFDHMMWGEESDD